MRDADALPSARPDGVVDFTNVLTQGYLRRWVRNQKRPLELGVDVVPTGFASWDGCCRDEGGGLGLAMGWHVIAAGNTGSGKSVLALNVACSALRHGMSVGFVSLEMSDRQLAGRLYSMLTDVPIVHIERGKRFDEGATERVGERLAEILGDQRLLVNRASRESGPLHELADIMALMDVWYDAGVRCFVIDYLQLAGLGNATQVAERVTEISRAIRGFAATHQCVTLGLSQFNRGTSGNYTDSPTVQGLFGASGLENDANQVVMLDHARYERINGADGKPKGARTWLILGKNRHGSTTEIPIWMDYETLRFMEALPHEEGIWPTHKKP